MGADNQQETSLYYYTGFCVGELSCSLLRLSNKKSKHNGVYYTPDITITNADYLLLEVINQIFGKGCGVITNVKGAFNLSFRGKRKVSIILQLFKKYPPIVGDLAKSKILVTSQALSLLENNKSWKRLPQTTEKLEEYRKILHIIKHDAKPYKQFTQNNFDATAIGHYLSGVWDAEGSIGMKHSGERLQPFAAIAMKEFQIIKLFHSFFDKGNIHFRKGNVVHWECGAKQDVIDIIEVFTTTYPSHLKKMTTRMKKVRRILNDYTPNSR